MTSQRSRAAAATFVLAAIAAPAFSQVFQGKQFDAGPNAYRFVTGDFNRDGHLDVVSSNNSDLRVLLGSGSGAFTPAGSFTPVPGGYLRWIVAAELTGDHKLDILATVDTVDQKSEVVVLRGDGAGGFSIASELVLVDEAHYAEVADIDGNGTNDVVMSDAGYGLAEPGTLITLFNDGTGTLTLGSRYEAGVLVGGAELGDVDGDGVLDAVLPDYGGIGISVLLGDGAGGFGAPAAFAALPFSTAAALADFNGDGALDVVVGIGTTGVHPVSVLLGDGAGGFGAPAFFPAGDKQSYLDVGDVNGDGKVDLLTVAITAGGSLVLGDGAGGFGAPTRLGIDDNATFAELADADGDGRLDVLATQQGFGPHSLTFLRGDGVGSFAGPLVFAGAPTAKRVLAVDVNHDGAADLVELSNGDAGARLAVLLGANGSFAPPVLGPLFGTATDAVLGDWNGDGVPDVAIAQNSPKGVGLAFGNGTALFPAPVTFPIVNVAAPLRIAAADVNLDGSLDAVVGFYTSFTTLLGDGAGHLSAPIVSPFSGTMFDLVLSDFSGDGVPDAVAVGFISGGYAAFARGNGAGGFDAAVVLDTADASARRVAVGDLDEDGALDLVVAGQQIPIMAGEPEDRVVVLKGNGAGGFTAQPSTYAPATTSDLAVFDADRDGHLDVVSVGQHLTFHRGDGSGALEAGEFFSNGPLLGRAAAADLDGDGDVDLAAVGQIAATVVVLRNDSKAPVGAAPYGAGTPGCVGVHGIAASSAPSVGNASFALVSTNAGAGARGLVLLSRLDDPAGSDPFGIGVTLHVDLFGAGSLAGVDVAADPAGVGRAPLPIPNVAALAGAKLFAQFVWVWPALAPCDPSPFGFSSSPGLAITVQ